MSTYDLEGVPSEDGWQDAATASDPCAAPCGTDQPIVPALEYDEPAYDEPAYDEPATEVAELDGSTLGESLDPEPVEPYVEPLPAYDPVAELPDEAATTARPEFEPVIYEQGTLVSQEPVAENLVTVEDLTDTQVYREWESVRGGFDLGAVGESVPGAVTTGSFASPSMVGDAGDVNFWFQQNSRFSCGPTTVAQILSDFTGVIHADESAIAARAQELQYLDSESGTMKPWYDPTKGMSADHVADLLTDQGVPATVHRDQDFADVEQYLREGRAVIMFLDARDVMPATGYEAFVAADEPENSAEDKVDHFVRVIGIDRANGVAIISNPGYPGASQVEIPLDQLEEAWNDNTLRSNTVIDRAHILIVSDGGDPTPDGVTLPDPGTTLPDPGAATGQPTGPEVPGPTGTEPGPGPEVPEPGPAEPGPGQDPTGPAERAAGSGEPVRRAAGPVELPDAGRTSGSGRPRIVELPAEGTSFDGARVARPVAPTGVTLPVAPDELAGAPDPAADDGDEPSSGTEAAAANQGFSLASVVPDVPGWVLIPVTLAAGRVGAALRERNK